MNKIYKVAIVGGGAAGLMCAVELLSGNRAFNGDEIVILERNDRVGKKLIATGNGQGNLTNAVITADNYSGDPTLISSFISQLKSVKLTEYLNGLGIMMKTDADGKIYPVSKQAN
ncbi:MAG: FAD-dependent oxidoreductase, partial [Clostridia bacterium]|nr:FAD-dependent oxidoreductase [Clostridia bacterium]